jgi:hypothetical protein
MVMKPTPSGKKTPLYTITIFTTENNGQATTAILTKSLLILLCLTFMFTNTFYAIVTSNRTNWVLETACEA